MREVGRAVCGLEHKVRLQRLSCEAEIVSLQPKQGLKMPLARGAVLHNQTLHI